jgi:hypothetical protein
MISEHGFNQEGADDLTKDFTAPIDQDYITLFIYLKGQEYDAITVGKNAAKAIVELFPYNFTKSSEPLTRATHESRLHSPPCSCPFPE